MYALHRRVEPGELGEMYALHRRVKLESFAKDAPCIPVIPTGTPPPFPAIPPAPKGNLCRC